MSAGTVVPLEEYLAHAYEPDREYINGEIVERNVGEYFHSLFQSSLTWYLGMLLRRHGYAYRVLTEARMRVRGGGEESRRYRIPDVMAVPVRENPVRIVLEPPLMVLEILSPDDRMSDVMRKCADYEAFGTPQIWVVDPESREVWSARGGVLHEIASKVSSFQAEGQEVVVDFNEVFASPGFA